MHTTTFRCEVRPLPDPNRDTREHPVLSTGPSSCQRCTQCRVRGDYEPILLLRSSVCGALPFSFRGSVFQADSSQALIDKDNGRRGEYSYRQNATPRLSLKLPISE